MGKRLKFSVDDVLATKDTPSTEPVRDTDFGLWVVVAVTDGEYLLYGGSDNPRTLPALQPALVESVLTKIGTV